MDLKINAGTFMFGVLGLMVGYLVSVLLDPKNYEKIALMSGIGMVAGAALGTYWWTHPKTAA